MISHIKKAIEIYKTISLNNDNQTLELEIRLGKYKKKGFVPGIPEICFNQILNCFNDWNITQIDETIFKDIPEKQRKNQGWILKDNIFQYDDKQENTRISLNIETLYSFKDVIERHNATNSAFIKEKIQLFRKKKRYSRTFNNWKLDLTQVQVYTFENNNWVKQNVVYECELEMIEIGDFAIWDFISPFHYGAMVFPFYSSLVKSNKFIGNQPKTLERENMHLLTTDYLTTDKLDGHRMFLISTFKGTFLLDNKLHATKNSIKLPKETIIDGEFHDNDFHAFDCLFYQGEDVRKKDLLQRLEILHSIDNLKVKQFVPLDQTKTFWETQSQHHLDGLIFTPIHQGYYGDILKWKPEHTMDVYIDEDFHLYAWSSKEKKNIPIASFFKASDQVQTLEVSPNVDINTIVELTYDSVDHVWIQKCVRNDKTKPNALLTVQSVIKAISENITIDDILKSLESQYQTPGKTYQERQEQTDIQYRKYHNKVKNHLLNYPPKEQRKVLLDLGCGKGGDIMKWIKAGYTDVLAIDNSHTHIYGPNGFAERYEKVKDKINITFVWGDVTKQFKDCGLNDSEKDKLKPWLNIKFDVVSCQFAIHYFLNAKTPWMMFMRNVQTHMKKGGYFIGTYLNAHNLSKVKQNHEFQLNGETFYTLKHSSPFYTEYNQPQVIDRYMAFWKTKRDKIIIHTSQWDKEIEENVLFPEHLCILLMKSKLKQIQDASFETLKEEINIPLSLDEELLSSLHNFFVYQFEGKIK